MDGMLTMNCAKAERYIETVQCGQTLTRLLRGIPGTQYLNNEDEYFSQQGNADILKEL